MKNIIFACLLGCCVSGTAVAQERKNEIAVSWLPHTLAAPISGAQLSYFRYIYSWYHVGIVAFDWSLRKSYSDGTIAYKDREQMKSINFVTRFATPDRFWVGAYSQIGVSLARRRYSVDIDGARIPISRLNERWIGGLWGAGLFVNISSGIKVGAGVNIQTSFKIINQPGSPFRPQPQSGNFDLTLGFKF
jgi:hypothetical protein